MKVSANSNKKRKEGRASIRFLSSCFFTSTPKVTKLTSKKKVDKLKNSVVQVGTPRVIVERHFSRGLLETPITIDATIIEEKEEPDLTNSKKRKRCSIKFPTPLVAASSKRSKKLFNEDTPKALGSLTIILDVTEEGELKDEEQCLTPQLSNKRLSDGDSSEVVFLSEKRASSAAKNAKRHSTDESLQPLPLPFSLHRQQVQLQKPSRFQRMLKSFTRHRRAISMNKLTKIRKENRVGQQNNNGCEQTKQVSHFNPHTRFDPCAPPNYQFSADIYDVQGQVFEFKADRFYLPSVVSDFYGSGCNQPPSAFSNVFNAGSPIVKRGLRPIVIDGPNVACAHGKISKMICLSQKTPFSCRGIDICVEYFKRRGHQKIVAFVPEHIFKPGRAKDIHVLNKLKALGHIQTTPTRSYDDRWAVQYASTVGGIVVSNDRYRDLALENRDMAQTIRSRKLEFRFMSSNVIMFPPDPMGRTGPSLDQMLSF